MNKALFSAAAVACAIQVPTVSAALIAGSDFSDSAVFNAAGGGYDNSVGSTDDLNLADNISVSDWSFANGGGLIGFDANAQIGMPNDNVTKFNGINNSSATPPILGSSGAALATHSFSLSIPAGTTLNLESVTFDFRRATPSGNQRWLAFDTSLDSGIIFSEIGLARDDFDSETIDLSGATYQGLTNTTVTLNWYAGGEGSGDIDIDTIIVNGTVIPEPGSSALVGLGALGLLRRRRR